VTLVASEGKEGTYGRVGLAKIHDVEIVGWENEQVSLGVV